MIGVVGLGLIGGSLALAWTRAGHRVVGVDRDPDAIRTGLERGAIEGGSSDPAAVLPRCRAVVLSVPVPSVRTVVRQIGDLLADGTVVFDVASVKREPLAALAELPARLEVVGGHPMCGRERSGIDAACPDLFQGRPFAICPLPGKSERALAFVRELVIEIGAVPLEMDADTHDRIVAGTSHLPYLLACCLARVVGEQRRDLPGTGVLRAGGYLDATRVSLGDPELYAGIVGHNRDYLVERVDAMLAELAYVRSLLGDQRELGRWATRARRERMDMVGDGHG